MDARKTLAEFKKKLDPEIEKYFERIIREAEGKDAIITEALRYVRKIILAGGKRLRPAFMHYGYLAAGGREKEKIIKTSIGIELIHAFLLIHDDIIDKDKKRHNLDTVNFKYEKLGKKFFRQTTPGHFGNSMAIIFGDMVAALGNQIIFSSDLNPALIVKALHKLQTIISATVVGQAKDICMECKKKATEKEVLKMYEYKTAKYTVEGPLHLGAILAGAGDKLLKTFSAYAIPAGIAFQIQDDILGVFGDEKKLGKPVGSDVRQGKYTLLVAKAFEQADNKQKKILSENLGNKNLSQSDIENFRKIIVETGALDYARNMATKLVSEGKRAIEKEKINPEAKEFLIEVADYMVKREV